MPINSIFQGTIDLSHKALDLRLKRQGLLQSNIANIDTPGYKAQDFSFEKVMAQTMTNQSQLAQTHQSHIRVDPLEAALTLGAQKKEEPVDIDEQMLKLSENNLMYQVATRIITKKFDGLRFAIEEGGK